MNKTTYFAIGDVHGMYLMLLELLKQAEGKIARDTSRRTLVFLGDYVDRGPESRQVVEHIMELQRNPGIWEKVIALRGNHEQMMVDAVTTGDPQDHFFWTRNGGRETMNSYGVQNTWDMPREPIDWMKSLPTRYIAIPEKLIFVHAGFYPYSYPDFDDNTAIWTRAPQFMNSEDQYANISGWDNPALEGYMAIHGHTPEHYKKGMLPYHDSRRINLDTGACFGGSLSCAIIRPGRKVEFVQATGGIILP
jgi:serine/threonine protein phosphatase 1